MSPSPRRHREEPLESPRYSLADVRRSYTAEKAWAEMEGDLPSYLLYRPLSYVPAWLALRIGIPITVMTLASGVLVVLMVWQTLRGGPGAYWWPVGCGLAFHVLDCVDGNMARTAGRSSSFGAVLDGLIDFCYWIALFACVGLLVEQQGSGLVGAWGLELGLGLAVVVLLNRQTRDNFTAMRGGRTYFRAERPERLSLGDRFLIAVVGLEGVYVFAIAAGGWAGRMDLVQLGMAVYVAAIFVGAIAMTLREAAALDRAP